MVGYMQACKLKAKELWIPVWLDTQEGYLQKQCFHRLMEMLFYLHNRWMEQT